MSRKASVYNRSYGRLPASSTGVKDAQRQYGFAAIGDYAATHHLRSASGAEQPPAEAVGSAASHA